MSAVGTKDGNSVSIFPHELTKEMFTKVTGKSSVAKLAKQIPIAFSGNEIMNFSLDHEVSIVAEGGAKPAGDGTINIVTIAPVKVVYQMRVNDEFVKAGEEKQISYLETFADGMSKKIARGLDIMVMHGLNPYDSSVSALIGTNCLDRNTSVSVETYTSGSEEADLTAAIADFSGAYDCTGIAMSPAFAAALSQVNISHVGRPYEDFMWGGNPGSIRGLPCDVNSTVAVTASGGASYYAYAGDFQNALRWGYAENIPLEVIRFGDPDGAGDLKRYNQVLLRAEAYIGWGILDGAAFARISSET